MLKKVILCGVALALTLSCWTLSVQADNTKKQQVPMPKGGINQPNLPKGNPGKADLAAHEIGGSKTFPENGEAVKEIALAFVKNVGNAKYIGTDRTATLWYKSTAPFGSKDWTVAASMKVPQLKVGEVCQFSTDPGHPATFKGTMLKLVVSTGDSNAGNDVLYNIQRVTIK